MPLLFCLVLNPTGEPLPERANPTDRRRCGCVAGLAGFPHLNTALRPDRWPVDMSDNYTTLHCTRTFPNPVFCRGVRSLWVLTPGL